MIQLQAAANSASPEAALVEDDAPPSEYYTRIVPTSGWISLGLKDLWDYRELLYFLAWRDVKVRYRQTILGAGLGGAGSDSDDVDLQRPIRAADGPQR